MSDQKTPLSRVTRNRNFFLPTQAEFRIKRLPDVEFFCQSVRLPGVSTRSPEQHNPFVPVRHGGDVLMFNELSVTFKVDEFLINYGQAFEWITRVTFPRDHEQYAKVGGEPIWTGEGPHSDCSVHFLDSRGRGRVEATVYDAIPVALSDIVVDTRQSDTQFLTATLSLAFTRYELGRITL